MSALVMLSGGLDSTYALYHAVNNYKGDIHVLHVIIDTQSSSRGAAEILAYNKIMRWFKKNYPNVRLHEYEAPSVTPMQAGSFDAFWHSMFVIQFCGQHDVDTLYLGECRDDIHRNEPGGATLLRRMFDAVYDWDEAQKAYEMGMIKYRPKFPKLIRPGSTIYKSQLTNHMPRDLIALTWSCRYPKFIGRYVKRCGKCGACKERAEIDEDLEDFCIDGD